MQWWNKSGRSEPRCYFGLWEYIFYQTISNSLAIYGEVKVALKIRFSWIVLVCDSWILISEMGVVDVLEEFRVEWPKERDHLLIGAYYPHTWLWQPSTDTFHALEHLIEHWALNIGSPIWTFNIEHCRPPHTHLLVTSWQPSVDTFHILDCIFWFQHWNWNIGSNIWTFNVKHFHPPTCSWVDLTRETSIFCQTPSARLNIQQWNVTTLNIVEYNMMTVTIRVAAYQLWSILSRSIRPYLCGCVAVAKAVVWSIWWCRTIRPYLCWHRADILTL